MFAVNASWCEACLSLKIMNQFFLVISQMIEVSKIIRTAKLNCIGPEIQQLSS